MIRCGRSGIKPPVSVTGNEPTARADLSKSGEMSPQRTIKGEAKRRKCIKPNDA
jgi:hypothetical protein